MKTSLSLLICSWWNKHSPLWGGDAEQQQRETAPPLCSKHAECFWFTKCFPTLTPSSAVEHPLCVPGAGEVESVEEFGGETHSYPITVLHGKNWMELCTQHHLL